MDNKNLFWISTAQGARPTWRFYALAVAGAAIFVGLLILAASLAIILLPVTIVLILVLRFLARRQIRRATTAQGRPGANPAQRRDPNVIEGDYEVVSENRTDRKPD